MEYEVEGCWGVHVVLVARGVDWSVCIEDGNKRLGVAEGVATDELKVYNASR